MPSEVATPSLGGESVRPLKHCPPLIDALSLGVLIPQATVLTFAEGAACWDWTPPALEDARISRAPIGMHVPEQASGAPFRMAPELILKFMNFWTLEAPEGWSRLFTHALNREDPPFRTPSGLVDCDLFRDGYVHFPALWQKPGFTDTLPAGPPVAQVISLPREAQGLETGVMEPAEVAANRAVQTELQDARGVYRRRFRH